MKKTTARVPARRGILSRWHGYGFSFLVCLLPALLQSGTALAEDALDRQIDIDISANTSLEDALIEWGRATGLTVMVNTATVHGQAAPTIQGHFTARAVLTALLKGSGLSYSESGGRIHVIPISSMRRSGITEERTTPPWAESADFPADTERIGGTGSDDSDTKNPANKKNSFNEVIVTAQKREERLQDVPVPVTAVTADTLVQSDQVKLKDYYSTIPGLSLAPVTSSQSGQAFSIRGIYTAGGGSPTVAVMIDEVPFGGSLGNGGVYGVPDLDPSDLARVEVLRGPQGTLYGESSMGGLVKFVTLDPSPSALSGHIGGGVSSIQNGDVAGYNLRGSINVPLTDTLAFRASALVRREPGYIDNPTLGLDGVNETDAYGVHASALWKPSETFSLKVSALFQDVKGYGFPDVDITPGLGDLQQNYILGIGRSDTKVQAYSAILTARFASAELTAITGYNINQSSDSWDLTSAFGPTVQALFGVGGAPVFQSLVTHKFTQEVRLMTPLSSQFDWLIGAFYSHENTPSLQSVAAEDTGTGQIVGQVVSYDTLSSVYEEIAGFTDLTYKITDSFNVQIGARESHIRQPSYDVITTSLGTPTSAPTSASEANSFTYLLTPQLKISPDLMVYARFASGYRAGGANTVPDAPPQYSPDKTLDYEIGSKGDFLDHALSFDASVYYIDWKDIQLGLTDPNGLAYTGNAGAAKSQGLEISTEARPVKGFVISAWAAWNEAVLTKAFPANSAVYGASGDRLPYSSRFSSSLSLTDNFPLAAQLTGSVGATVSYVGERLGTFNATPQRQDLPGYTKLDLRAGVQYNTWAANVFANNVTNKRGILNGGLGQFPEYAFTLIQPRTIGLNVEKSF
jgi:outer membrane receptor protein involved in Fe transport